MASEFHRWPTSPHPRRSFMTSIAPDSRLSLIATPKASQVANAAMPRCEGPAHLRMVPRSRPAAGEGQPAVRNSDVCALLTAEGVRSSARSHSTQADEGAQERERHRSTDSLPFLLAAVAEPRPGAGPGVSPPGRLAVSRTCRPPAVASPPRDRGLPVALGALPGYMMRSFADLGVARRTD